MFRKKTENKTKERPNCNLSLLQRLVDSNSCSLFLIAKMASNAINSSTRDEMKRVYLQSIKVALESVPDRTKKSYEPKQREFMQFCLEEKYDDGIIVYAEKLNHFLVKKVLACFCIAFKAFLKFITGDQPSI
jgi:hypothetical protein